MSDRIAVLGAGVMGETVLSGLLRSGWSPEQVVVTEKRPERRQELTDRYGVGTAENPEAVSRADTVILVVKPQDVAGLLDEIAPVLRPGVLVVSIAAGVAIDQIQDRLPAGTPVVRVMPNTPAQVDEGMAAISPGSHAGQEHLDRVTAILSATGRVVTVPEAYQDAVTAISGSGPAYVFLVVEALIESGVHLGLPRETATELAVQTVYGSAKLVRETGDHPALLRERVTSPGGTTAAALRVLEDHKIPGGLPGGHRGGPGSQPGPRCGGLEGVSAPTGPVPVEGDPRPRLVFSEALTAYDFGPGHPMAPGRVANTVSLAKALGCSTCSTSSHRRPPTSDSCSGSTMPTTSPR